MRVALKRQLARPVGAPDPRTLDRHTPAAERDLASLAAVAHRDPLSVVPPLRSDDLVDLLFHQLGEHTEADSDAQRE